MKELIVKAPAFEHEGLIPIEHTGYGADISPELWTCIIKSHTLDHNLVKGDGKKWEVNIQRNFVATH